MSAPVAPPSTPPRKTFAKDPEAWFPEGDIVFFSNIDGLCFRVHSGMLSKYSAVLRDKITTTRALAQKGDTNTLWVEGSLAIKVGDSGEVIQSLLQALYARPGPSLNMQDEEGFRQFASLLRSANKYRINWLRTEALKRLTQHWPHLQEEFEKMNNNIWRPHPAVIIKLARDVRGFHLFPFALYRLGMLSYAELDHTLPISQWPAVTLSRSQVERQLPAQDLARYIYFQERRRDVVYSFMRDFMDQFKPDSSCQEETSGKCTEAFSRVISHLRDPSIMLMSGPLELPGQALRLAENDRGICTACRKSFSHAVKERKIKLWDELPSLFGLPDWNTLREASSVAG